MMDNKHKQNEADFSTFMRNQSYPEVLANYFSNQPQVLHIKSADEFYSLYENFDMDFYKELHKCHEYTDIEIYNHYHLVGKYRRSLTNNLIKVVFYTPKIGQNIGGVNALYRAAKLINDKYDKNIKAFIYTYDHKKHKNNYCNNFVHPFEIDNNTFVVYPEVISGNPLGAKNVIRWILLELGYEMPKNHYSSWGKNDLVFSWEPHKMMPQLCCPWIDKNILENSCYGINKENDSAYMFRKMQNIQEIKSYTKNFHNKDSIDLDKLSHHAIIRTFLKTSKFYSYDPNTFYNLIAPLCGCITILHPIPGVPKDEYLRRRITNNGDTLYDAGIAYGTEESEIHNALTTLPFAKQQMKKLISHYESNIDSFLSNLKDIIIYNIKPTNTVASIFYNSSYHKCQS